MSTIKIHGRIIPFRSMVNNHHNLPEAWWWFSTPKDLVDVLSKFHLDPPPPSPLPFRRAPRGGDGGTFGWMTSTNWAAQKKGGNRIFFLCSWWFWIWFFSMIFWKKIHCLLDDWCIFVSGVWNSFGFTDALARFPTTHHPETSTRNEVHDLDGFYASIHALLGPFPGGWPGGKRIQASRDWADC